MPRLLGLDVGEKTIGIALSDERQVLAFPGETLWRQEGYRKDMARLRELIAAQGAEAVVVGLPLTLDGSESVQTQKVREFIKRLRNYVRIPIIEQDERLTTWEAEQVLIEANVRRETRKKTIDSMAACLILQSYLDSRRAKEDATEAM